MLVDLVIEKAIDFGITKAKDQLRKMDENQAFSAACKNAEIEYEQQFGEDKLFTLFYKDGFDREQQLQRIVTESIASREICSNIIEYISQETEWEEADEKNMAFSSMLISELMFTEEFKEKMCQIRRDYESGQTSADVKRIITMLQQLEQLISQQQVTPTSDMHCLTNPPVKNEGYLLHRDALISDLQNQICSGENKILLYGLGGIGKTAIASSLYHLVKYRFKQIAWVNYQDSLQKSILSSFKIHIQDQDDEMRYKQIESFLNNSTKDTILFIDNIDKLPSEDTSLQLLQQIDAKVVMTSRTSDIPHYKSIEISFLSLDESVDVFYLYYKYDRQHSQIGIVKELIKLVSYHTLSVELLAKAANRPDICLQDYLDNLQIKGFGYPDLRVSTDHTIQSRTIADHLTKLFELAAFTLEQQKILKNFAILPNMDIPADVIQCLQCDINDIMRLSDFGWFNITENGYLMPDIVKKVLEIQLPNPMFDDYPEVIKYMSTDGFIKRTDDYVKVKTRLIIAEAIIDRFQNIKNAKLATFLNEIAIAYENQGNYDNALGYFKKALAIFEKVLGKEHPDTATAYNNNAGIYKYQGDYNKAFVYYNKALTIREKVLGKEHRDTARTYNNIAGVYLYQGKYDNALGYFKKALAIFEKVLEKEHPDNATAYNNIASVYQYQGDYDKALVYYNKALIISEKVLGKEHPDTAISYNNIASVYQYQGDYNKALVYYNKALIISEKVLGEEHPDTFTTYNNIAGVYRDQGNYDKALDYFNKALTIREKVLGKEHPDTARTYNNIAGVYLYQGKYDKALGYFKKALAIFEKVLEKEHPDTAAAYNNIAMVYKCQGHYVTALDYYNKALAICVKVLGKEHLDTAASYNNIAMVYQCQGDYDTALDYYNKALSIYEKVLGKKEHPNTAASYNNIAMVFQYQGDYNTALDYYNKALSIYERVLGKEHPDTAKTYNNIAGVYYRRGDFKKSLDYSKSAYRIFYKKLGINHRNTQIVKDGMKQTFLSTRKSSEEFDILLKDLQA